jgi:DNA replication and repair protein RecF
VEFRLDDDLAKVRASQGQARTLALAWKWEERLFLKERVGREPLCLLDDVFSELDPGTADSTDRTGFSPRVNVLSR